MFSLWEVDETGQIRVHWHDFML